MKKIFLIQLLTISFLASAQTTYVELPDGNKIIINENKTWDFVEKNQTSKENSSNIDANNIWKNENISINTTGWIKSRAVSESHLASYTSEKRDNYFAVYEEVADITLPQYINLTIKQNQKEMKKLKIVKQLSFKQNGKNHAQVIISAEVEELPVSYVYNFYSFKGGYTTVVGWTLGKNTAQLEDLKNRVNLNN